MKQTLLAIAAVLVPAIAVAQDTPKVGLTMGYPATVGLIWQIGDKVSVRPEITLSRSSDETSVVGATSGQVTSGDSTVVGVAVSGLIYVSRWDALRAYVSPRFSYSRNSSSSSLAPDPPLLGATTGSTTTVYGTSGSFGAQYALGRRFGLFGEVGLTYQRTSGTSSSTFTVTTTTFVNGVLTTTTVPRTSGSTLRSNTVATRTAVGVILFF